MIEKITAAQKKINTEKFQKYIEIEKRLINLTDSPLYDYRQLNNYKPVLGEGNLNSKVMFVGEAPGSKEAITGKPFVGPAGIILTKLLLEIGIHRQDIFITSTIHDRPPNNRKPTKEEIQIYFPILESLIELIKPKIIVAMGNTPFETLLAKLNLQIEHQPMSQIRGRILNTATGIKLIPIYHPAYLLYQAHKREEMQEDLKIVSDLINSI